MGVQRNASSGPCPLDGGSLRLSRPLDCLGGGSGGGSMIFCLEGDDLLSGFISNFGTQPRPLSSSDEEEDDAVDSGVSSPDLVTTHGSK